MKRALLALILIAGATLATLTPSTAEARNGYRGGYYRPAVRYNYGYRPSYYGGGYYRPSYGYTTYRPSYGYYNTYRPYYGGYYNAYRPNYGGGYYYRPGVQVYAPGVGVYVR